MSNHHITLHTAIDLTTRYRNHHPSDFFICESYEADAIQDILNVTGCAYLRIYLGRKADDSVVTVLVAANSDNEDILPSSSDVSQAMEPNTAVENAVLLEDGYRCPEACPPKSKLNS